MNKFKALLFGAACFAVGLAAVAQGQVNTVPQIGVETAILKQRTYSAVSVALVPAASATDIFCVSGSSTMAVSIKQFRITGTAGTLVTAPFTLLRRASLDTGGTAATGAALPIATPHMSGDSAATATLTAYTANPTIVDSSPLYLASSYATIPTTAAGTSIVPVVWSAGERIGEFTKAFDIPRGTTTQQYCINLNAVSISSGLLHIDMTWLEQ